MTRKTRSLPRSRTKTVSRRSRLRRRRARSRPRRPRPHLTPPGGMIPSTNISYVSIGTTYTYGYEWSKAQHEQKNLQECNRGSWAPPVLNKPRVIEFDTSDGAYPRSQI